MESEWGKDPEGGEREGGERTDYKGVWLFERYIARHWTEFLEYCKKLILGASQVKPIK